MRIDEIEYGEEKISANTKSYVLREGEIEVSLSGRYVSVYTCDRMGNYSYLYDISDAFSVYFRDHIKEDDIHKTATSIAFTGKRVSYEWFDDEKIPAFFNTIIIPLSDKHGFISNLLFIVKEVDDLCLRRKNKMILAEKAGDSFVQIIMKAREEEKRVLTSAIHDQLGNFAIRANVLLEALYEDILTKKPKETLKTLRAFQTTLQETVRSMKDFITSFRPPQLESVGLEASIRELLEKFAESNKIKISYSYKIKNRNFLSPNIETVLYRAVQEGLSNTVKYAQAKNFTVELTEDSTSICLIIKDDGRGFVPQVHKGVKSLGLAGMKENVVALKGTMKLKSKLGKGTTILIKCPKFQYIR